MSLEEVETVYGIIMPQDFTLVGSSDRLQLEHIAHKYHLETAKWS